MDLRTRRRKHLFSRDKLKLFLKQHCEPQDGVIKIKEDSIANKQTVAGYRNRATKERDKLLKQEEMKSLAFEKAKLKREKADALEAKKKEKEDKEKKKEELKKIVEEERLKKKEEKERLKIEREKEREKLREEKKKYMEYLKQWSKPREDMECDDLKAIAEEEEEVAKEQITDADTKGADVTSANAKYRYQKRGGFDATDDACMELRLSNPSLVKKLSSTSVYDLTPGEKMKILHALCGKLLTLVSTRDFIEDYVDILRQAKQEFRELKAEQHRKEREEAAARIRKRKEEKLKEQEQKMKEKQEKLKEDEQRNSVADISVGEEEREDFDTSTESKEIEQKEQDQDTVTEDEDDPGAHKRSRRGRRGQNGFKECTRQEEVNCVTREPLTADEEEALKQEHQRKEKELLEKIQSAIACTNIFPLGRDRMYRRYWIFPSIPGLFIEEDYSGLTEDMLLPRPSSFQDNVQSQDPQVTDRNVWRSALESGRYELLNEENKENGIIKTVNEDVEEMEIDEQAKVIVKDRLLGIKTESPSTVSTNASTPQSVSNVVHYLAMALFQIEQGIERRFLKAPLECRPKQRSRRLSSRQRPSLESDDEMEDSMESEDDEVDDDDEEGQSEEEEYEVEQDEDDSQEEEDVRVIATKSSEQSRSLNVASKLSLQDSESKRRGRKRQSTESSPMTLNRRSSGRQGGVHELSAFEQLVVELVRHDDSWPFLKLVSKIQVPDYYDIIKKPIALNIIREKVNKCEYKLASEFIDDIELMFSNCFEYNPRNTSEAKAGTRLQAFFHIQAQKLGLNVTPGSVDQVSTPPAAKKSRI
ncbi:hypothetical protein J1605_018233 [Eschrichtius robustus]|uniref:Bromo domain-containing protein n=1 Tax=Eschrichtius robustus TaxID=9764 RepID=A0AB34HZ98_ESCRO|nr:hypothetical protein J1605_018233 [Eschrichtius robustus]